MALVNRWYHILNRMVHQKTLGAEGLKTELGISQQTLAKSIRLLNDLLNDVLRIHQEGGQLTLEVYDYEAFEQILLGSLRRESDFNSGSKRASYLLKRLIEADRPLLIDDLAEEIGVSRGTINKDLRQAKQLAQAYQTRISGVPNRGLEISGAELDLRLLYLHQVCNYFDCTELTPASTAFLEGLGRQYRLPNRVRDMLGKVLALLLQRFRQQEQLDTPLPFYRNELDRSKLMEELLYHVESCYQLSLSHYEADFLSFPLNSAYIEGLPYQKSSHPGLLSLFEQLLDRVAQDFLVNLDSARLVANLQTHLKFLVNRLIFRLETADIFQGEIQTKYPLAFEMAREVGQLLAGEFQREISLPEISYLALYFEMALRDNTDPPPQQRKIAVVCTTGRGTAVMMMRQLRRVLGEETAIVQYAEEEVKASDLEDYFAIFTTIPLKFEKSQVPVIQMTHLFDDSWLREEWQKVRLYHQKNLETLTLRFIRLKAAESYEAYLDQMLDRLQEEGLTDDDFRQAIFRREAKQSTLFGGGIAFPHTINTFSTKSFLMLGVLEEPYPAEIDQITFIFMVGIPSAVTLKGEEELLELYDDIFRVAGDAALKAELQALETEEDFMRLTKERGVF